MEDKNLIPLYHSGFYQKRAAELMQESLRRMNEGNYADARESIESAMICDPTNQQACYLAGYIYYNLEEYERSLACIEKVAGEQPGDLEIRYIYGIVLMRNKKFQESKRVFEALLFDEKEKEGLQVQRCWNVMYYLHLVHAELREYESSLRLLHELERVHACVEVIWFEMARIYLLQDRYQDAVLLLEKIVLYDPKFQLAYHLLVESCVQERWYPKAIQWLEREVFYFPEKEKENEQKIRTLQQQVQG